LLDIKRLAQIADTGYRFIKLYMRTTFKVLNRKETRFVFKFKLDALSQPALMPEALPVRNDGPCSAGVGEKI
jgi:hypothetical protein